MTLAKLCVTVTAATTAELRTRRDQVEDADIVELRLDTVSDPDAAAALAGRKKPVIVTCRHRAQGGHFIGSEAERRRILSEALALGAEYVDLEWRESCADLIAQTGGRRIVLSHHDFGGVPADLEAMAQAMRATGAEVVKLAVMASRLSDCVTLRDLGRDADIPMALIAMGEAGLPSRVLAGWMGSCWTYAGDGVAPGQISAQSMVDAFGFRRIGPRTALYGVVGKPVSHSMSPAMHNAAFRAATIDAVYLPLAAADFSDFTTFARAAGLAGASVTAPFKVDAFEHADECDAASRRIESVNTLRRVGDTWFGTNTDVSGFLAPLEAAMQLAGARATILGAGGAARSVAVALASAGARVSISARRAEQAQSVAALAGCELSAWPPDPSSWDLLVNATPVGTAPDTAAMPLPDQYPFRGHGLVYDLVYNPPVTQLLERARRAGCRTLGGLDMLVAQAQAQFEWWTGLRPSEGIMREAALARLTGHHAAPSGRQHIASDLKRTQ
ncbi:MAG TPA: shikimate dehydrogenase [Vicinamibacterales bacterium]|nr:shikimate dehydrogenase [Vicinamibacterales bacterium]